MKNSFLGGMLLIIVLAACQPAGVPGITIQSATGETSLGSAGAMFMVIKNTGNAPEKLISGKSSACGSIEMHKMVMKSDGSMGMNLIDQPLEIPAGGQVEMKNGGYHIMCILKNDQFKPGNEVDLTLLFEKAGEKTISVQIRK